MDEVETFRCARCGHNVPTINRVVHAATCRHTTTNSAPSSTSARSSTFSAPSSPPSAPSSTFSTPSTTDSFNASAESESDSHTIECPRCTFLNSDLLNFCEMCEAPLGSGSGNQSTDDQPPGWQGQRSTTQSDGTEEWEEVRALDDDDGNIFGYSHVRITSGPNGSSRCETRRESRNNVFSSSNRTTSNNSDSTSSENISPASLLASGALLGAGFGAGWAFLGGRNVARGAMDGASMGVLGAMLASGVSSQATEDETSREETSTQQAPSFFDTLFGSFDTRDSSMGESSDDNLAGGLLNSMFSEIQASTGLHFSDNPRTRRPRSAADAYQALIEALRGELGEFDMESFTTGAPPARSVNELPTHTLEVDLPDCTCAVCLETFRAGEVVKTLPCSHQYHLHCIDAWLNRSSVCPICKHSILENE